MEFLSSISQIAQNLASKPTFSLTSLIEEEPMGQDRIVLNGKLLDDLGDPLVGRSVELWQTDKNGNYRHPNPAASNTGDEYLENFQYYGADSTNDFGEFKFTTYRPGIYSGRPITHFHVKFWDSSDEGGDELLTTQFYFRDENTNFDESLILDLEKDTLWTGADDSYNTNVTVVIDTFGSGPLEGTPSQQQGPFYPVIDFSGYDNDLTSCSSEL